MANLLDQIGQRNVVRVVSQGVPATLSGLSDTDFSGIGTGMVPVWDGDAFTTYCWWCKSKCFQYYPNNKPSHTRNCVD